MQSWGALEYQKPERIISLRSCPAVLYVPSILPRPLSLLSPLCFALFLCLEMQGQAKNKRGQTPAEPLPGISQQTHQNPLLRGLEPAPRFAKQTRLTTLIQVHHFPRVLPPGRVWIQPWMTPSIVQRSWVVPCVSHFSNSAAGALTNQRIACHKCFSLPRGYLALTPAPAPPTALDSLSRLAAASPACVPHGLSSPPPAPAVPVGFTAAGPAPAPTTPLFCRWGCSRFDASAVPWHLWSASWRCRKQKFFRQVPQATCRDGAFRGKGT